MGNILPFLSLKDQEIIGLCISALSYLVVFIFGWYGGFRLVVEKLLQCELRKEGIDRIFSWILLWRGPQSADTGSESESVDSDVAAMEKQNITKVGVLAEETYRFCQFHRFNTLLNRLLVPIWSSLPLRLRECASLVSIREQQLALKLQEHYQEALIFLRHPSLDEVEYFAAPLRDVAYEEEGLFHVINGPA